MNSRRKQIEPIVVVVSGIGALFVFLGVFTLVARVVLVSKGVLYGVQAVSRVDVAAAGFFGIGIVAAAYVRARFLRAKGAWQREQKTSAEAGGGADGSSTEVGDGAGSAQPAGWINDRLSAIIAIVSAGALVISLINLFVPVQLPVRPKAACPGTQDRSASYVGITSGVSGNNSRSGPSLSYPAVNRFPPDCTIGFSHYCIGDPLQDPQGTIENVQYWRTSRWLVVAKQPPGWRARLASLLSGEDSTTQYVTDAAITPATSSEDLPYLGDAACPGNFRLPGAAEISNAELDQGIVKATASRAVNMGFAVWIPSGDAFFDGGDAYHQIYDETREVGENPGSTQPDGSKKVVWTHDEYLRPEAAGRPAVVVVMAIPCLTDNIPADVDTAAITAYDVGSGSAPVPSDTDPRGFDERQLARAACQTNAV